MRRYVLGTKQKNRAVEEKRKNYLSNYRGGITGTSFGLGSVFMHDPVGFLSFRSSASVKDQSFLHPDKCFGLKYLLVFPCRFPVTSMGGSVGSHAGWIFSIPHAEEVPFFFAHFRHPCISIRPNKTLLLDWLRHMKMKNEKQRKNRENTYTANPKVQPYSSQPPQLLKHRNCYQQL